MSKPAPAPLYRGTIVGIAVVAVFAWAGAILVLILMMTTDAHLSPLPAALFVIAGTLTVVDAIIWAVSCRTNLDVDIDEATETLTTVRQRTPVEYVSAGRTAPVVRGVATIAPAGHAPSLPAGDTMVYDSMNADAVADTGRRIRVVTCVLVAMLMPEHRGFDAVETAYEIGRKTGPRSHQK